VPPHIVHAMFSDIDMSQGIVTMQLSYGRLFNYTFLTHFLLSVTVKKCQNLSISGDLMDKSLLSLFARDSIYAKRAYAIAIPSVRLSVTRVDQSKPVEVRIVQFSLYSSPITLVFPR